MPLYDDMMEALRAEPLSADQVVIVNPIDFERLQALFQTPGEYAPSGRFPSIGGLFGARVIQDEQHPAGTVSVLQSTWPRVIVPLPPITRLSAAARDDAADAIQYAYRWTAVSPTPPAPTAPPEPPTPRSLWERLEDEE